MAESDATSARTPSTRVETSPPRPRRRWPWVLGLGILVVPAAIVALWTWITLSFAYSTGDRAGYVQKLSRKGWICKTWEGELAMANIPGAMRPRPFAPIPMCSAASTVMRCTASSSDITFRSRTYRPRNRGNAP